MDVEETNLTLKDLLAPPPLMPWRNFADWIRMGDSHDIVWGWIRNGYIPSVPQGRQTHDGQRRIADQPTDG